MLTCLNSFQTHTMQKSIIYYNTSRNGRNWVKSISNLNFENKIEVSAPHRDQKQMVALKIFKLFLANASFWNSRKNWQIFGAVMKFNIRPSSTSWSFSTAAPDSSQLSVHLHFSILSRCWDSFGDTTKLLVIVTLRHFTHRQRLSSHSDFVVKLLVLLSEYFTIYWTLN